MYISNTGSFTACHKVSSGGDSNELDLKARLPQVLLVHFLLTELSLGLSNGDRFHDMINYTSEPLAILEIYRNTMKETYI